MRLLCSAFSLALVLLFSSQDSLADTNASRLPDELKGIGITEHLGNKVSIQDLSFRDESAKTVKLAEYFRSGRPVVLSLVYYGCPNLCTFVLNGLVDVVKKMQWTPGNQFEVVVVSINPNETPSLAAQKKAAYLASYGKAESAQGWHFLTGEDSQIRKLADEVGFGYRWNAAEGQYAHGAAVYALTPQGKISRYLYGIEYQPQDLKLALLEASSGKVGNVIDRFLLFCYRYDPQTRKYSVYLTRLMQASGAGTVVVFMGYLGMFWRRQRRRESPLVV